jgi:uncharacterized protein
VTSQARRTIIDTDVHPYVRGGLKTLLQYMPRASRERFALVTHNAPSANGGSGLEGIDITTNKWNPPNRYTNPHPGVKVGVLRPDATPPDGGLPGSDPQFVVKDLLDAYSISAALLLPVASAGGGHVESNDAYQDANAGQAYVSAVNNYFIENWLPVDRRFVLALQLLTRDPEGSVREIKRHQGKPGVAAIFMPLTNLLMGDRFYHPIYRAAQEYELPIVIHPFGAEGNSLAGPVLAGGVPATYLERHVGLTQVGQANMSSLILNGVFDKFPRLRIVFAELGFTWAAPLVWRLDRDWKRMREETPAVKKFPSEYFVERIRFTTQPMEEPDRKEDLVALLEMMRADRTLMFSSDYPHWDNDHPLTTLAQLHPALQERVYSRNALETFGHRLAEVAPASA